LGHRLPGEKTELNKLCLEGLFVSELGERFVQGQEVKLPIDRERVGGVCQERQRAATAFGRLLAPSGIHQNTSHSLGCGGEEVAARVEGNSGKGTGDRGQGCAFWVPAPGSWPPAFHTP